MTVKLRIEVVRFSKVPCNADYEYPLGMKPYKFKRDKLVIWEGKKVLIRGRLSVLLR